MPKNEVKRVEASVPTVSGGLAIQQKLLSELDKAGQEFGIGFTDYGRRCAINAIAGVVMFTKQNGISIYDIDPTLLRLEVQNVGYTELNCATQPSEVYFDVRKSINADGKTIYQLKIKPQGAGNEKLVRTYGVGIKKGTGLSQAILVHEGDELVLPSYNGATVTPFKYTPKFENANNKVVAVIYVLEKVDGKFEYLYATRESVKANIVAQIRQNALYAFKKVTGQYTDKYGNKKEKYENDPDARDAFYEHVNELAEKMTVDELVNCKELQEYINPTYTSGGSKEAMIIRKMKNNALKNYPKEFDNSIIEASVHNMWEEDDTSVLEKKDARKVIDNVNAEIDEDVNEDTIEDFDVTKQEGVEQSTTPQSGLEQPSVDQSGDAMQTSDEDDDIPF